MCDSFCGPSDPVPVKGQKLLADGEADFESADFESGDPDGEPDLQGVEREGLRANNLMLQGRCAAWEDQVSGLVEERDRYRKRVSDSMVLIAGLRSRNSRLRSRIRTLEGERAGRRKVVLELEATLRCREKDLEDQAEETGASLRNPN